jgi:hypothetical protein
MPDENLTSEEFQELLKGCRDIFQPSIKDTPTKFQNKPIENPGKFSYKIKLPADLVRL